jgi:alkanesulfonate monooxygenase SsuD/methylene tetrahydromethanopterin reductase-like flavin-dependent oxidoreductase (luciferase family)
VRETIEMIRAAAAGKPLTYKGELYKAWRYNAGWAHDKAPLIYAGASKRQMLRMAAEVADGTMMSDATLHYVPDLVGIARERLAELGRPARDFRISNFWAWHVKKDAATSMREARRELILRGWLVRFHLERFMTPEECDFIEAHKQAFTNAYNDRSGDIKGVPPAMVDKLIEALSCAGDFATMDQHVARLKAFDAAGLTEIALRLHDQPMDAIRMIGERVMPAFR